MSEFYLNKLPDSIIVMELERDRDSRVECAVKGVSGVCLGGAKERCGADVLMRRDVWTVCRAACRCIGLMYED